MIALDGMEIGYDFAGLVDQLCRRLPNELNKKRIDKPFSCRKAIEHLNANPKMNFKTGLKIDEFKQIALELGVWN